MVKGFYLKFARNISAAVNDKNHNYGSLAYIGIEKQVVSV